MTRTRPGDRTKFAASDLYALDHELRRCRAQAGRLWRSYQAMDDAPNTTTATSAHQAWSDAVEEAIATADAISKRQPSNLDELRIQFEAAWWWIVEDDSILDGSARRWLRRFGLSLHRLAAAAEKKS